MAARLKAAARPAKRGFRTRLSAAEKLMLEEQFTHSRATVTEEDAGRLVRRGVGEADAISRAAPGWKVNLASQVKLLFDVLRAWWRGKARFPKASALAITAALLYFVNPFDVVPDFVPIAGWLDDATIIAMCIRLVQSDLRRFCRDHRIEASAFGL